MKQKLKSVLIFLIPLSIFGLFIFWPTFNLNMVGDDYLGLWRYHYYLDGHNPTQHWNNFNFFFTDYGPQDTFTAIIHSLVGWTPQYYYATTFILRMLAATSIYFLVKFLTKKTIPAVLAGVFFAVTATGLEATDWSFNMPSYLAISLMCLYFLTYIKALQGNKMILWILTFVLFYITIISQPIRMTFLPLCMVLIEGYIILTKRTKKALLSSLLRITLYVGITVGIFITGFLGNSVGAGETLSVRLHGGWRAVGSNFSVLFPLVKRGMYAVLLLPIAQFGKLFIPDSIIPPGYQLLTTVKSLKIAIPLLVLFSLIVLMPFTTSLKKYKSQFSYTRFIFLGIGALWSILIWTTFNGQELLYTKIQFLDIDAGGMILILLGYWYSTINKKSRLHFPLVLGIIIATLPFITPWLRSPTFLFESTGRYLIVPATGAAILIGVIANIPEKITNQKLLYVALGLFILFHAGITHSYFTHLTTVRSIAITNTIRKSVPRVKNFGGKEPLVFYFEPANSEILHHSLLFGFPVIMGDQYHFYNVWNMAYTEDWNEVEKAYIDGSSLKRFSIPTKPVKLTNIYSFKLDGTNLADTTNETRTRLTALTESHE